MDEESSSVPFVVFNDETKVHAITPRQSNATPSPRKITMCALASLIPDLANRRERDQMRQFAKGYLCERECTAYVERKHSICGCGRAETWHQQNNVSLYPDSQAKWNPEHHTKIRPSTAYGEIEFPGFGNRTAPSPYARVDYQTDPPLLWTLLHDVWDLPPPKLVISVTGGAKRFFMKRRLKNAFKQGLIDIAATTDAWIITGGTATGVMQYVGEAVQEYQLSSDAKRIVAIGIASWGCVDNKESLQDSDGSGLFPAVYSLRDCSSSGSALLDHNHTHFILADNGSVNKFGTEINLRARLEEHIRGKCPSCLDKNQKNKPHQCVGTPVVLIVVEGGVNTMRTVLDAIRLMIPVVVIKGTGRVAEIICLAYKMTKPKHSSQEMFFPMNFDAEMTLLCTKHLLPLARPEEIPEMVEILTEVLKNRNMLTIFELDDSSCYEMDKAVLSALLKAKKSNPQSQVDLALIWNRADVARHQIFTVENRQRWQAVALDDAMNEALVSNREDFVQLFIDNGVQLSSFLTIRRLRNLYIAGMEDKTTTMSIIFKNLLNKVRIYGRFFTCHTQIGPDEDISRLLQAVGEMISFLLNDKVHMLYSDPKYIIGEDHNSRSSSASSNDKRHSKKFHNFENPEKDLFLWALMFNKHRLARMCWKQCLDPIGKLWMEKIDVASTQVGRIERRNDAELPLRPGRQIIIIRLGGALLGSRLLKSLADEAESQEEVDLSVELYREANHYEQLACGVLSTCYCLNKTMSHKLLTRELTTWGSTTLFSLAESAELMDFMQLSCCQTKLNRIWYGKMVDHTPEWKILMVTFLPFLIYLIRFKNVAFDADLPTPPPDMKTPEADALTNKDGPLSLKKKKLSVAFAYFLRKKEVKKQSISFYKALYEFYTSPVTKFYVNMIFYMLFLSIFTFVVLTELRPVSEFAPQGIMEIIIWGWGVAFALEEIREVVTREAKSVIFKLSNHLKSFWNQLDLLTFLFFCASITLRLQNRAELDHTVKIIYALTVLFGYLRFMEFFYVSKMIGPKIIMIQKMLKDLVFFICILFVFILSFGIAMQALLYPNEKFSVRLLIDAVYTPYWQIFGELFLDRAEAKLGDCTTNSTLIEMNSELKLCAKKSWLVPALFAIYMMLTNVLLLNLLIAMFSYTFQQVQENSEKVWRFYRYSVIHHFFESPSIPAPFVIVNIFIRAIRFCLSKVTRTYRSKHGFKVPIDDEENIRLSAFEKAGRERFLANTHRMSVEQMDSRVAESAKRIQKVMEDLEEIKEHLTTSGNLVDSNEQASRVSTANVALTESEKLSKFGEKLDRQSELLHELIKILTRPKLHSE